MQKSARHFSQCFHFKSLRFGKKSRAPPQPPLKLAPALRTACANVTGKEKRLLAEPLSAIWTSK
jgi:hypothetical protein